jgi:HPt (histidine-containing phosphotransfer) domain-containing protein
MSQSLINRKSLNEFMEDDPELLGDLSVIFVRALPDVLAKLNFSIENSDSDSLRESAHQLKSQLSYFFCESLVSRALELEELGRQDNTRDARTVATDLNRGIEKLLVELNQLTGLHLIIEED